ncbi:Cof-type HAD-IIB family hydrolase [Pediococcus ethanolidurans]
MSIRLIALDIDDTLLDSKGKLLPNTVATIKAALANGVKVVLCSGRPLAGVKLYTEALGITGDDQYAITYNGAVIESISGHVVARHLVNNADYRKMTKYGQQHQIAFNVLDANSEIYTADHDVNRITVVQAWENSAGILIRTPDELPADFEIAKGLFVGEKDELDAVEAEVRATFEKDFYVVRAGQNFLELMNPVVNKGQALQDLANNLHLNADEVMAVGDERNDIPMFKFAGTAVSMGNGIEVAKQNADYVTDTNDNDGLAKAIQKFVLN